MTVSLPRQPSAVARARHILATLLSLTDIGDEVRANLAVVISEACSNAVIHADPSSAVDLTISIDDDVCVIEVGNRGSTPAAAKLDADLPAPLTIGGRGLPLIAALSDAATFVDGPPDQVLLRITKNLGEVGTAP
ncbi:ATP-binding protein [Micromonospora sp. NPDC051543]|uniref:ATP-binding protein n=1 Tax=Micromonospora sp. NPDC051543 TaxID=3364287 RepID=UPI00379862E4